MSTSNSQSEYTFVLTTATGNNEDTATFNCYSPNGMSDTFASQIVEALRGITPPTGSTIQCTVSKQSMDTTVYTTNYPSSSGGTVTFS